MSPHTHSPSSPVGGVRTPARARPPAPAREGTRPAAIVVHVPGAPHDAVVETSRGVLQVDPPAGTGRGTQATQRGQRNANGAAPRDGEQPALTGEGMQGERDRLHTRGSAARALGIPPWQVPTRVRQGSVTRYPDPVRGGWLYALRPPREGESLQVVTETRHVDSTVPVKLRAGYIEGAILAHLPSSQTGLARTLSLSGGCIYHRLRALEASGLVRSHVSHEGKRGRPQVIWEVVA